MPTTVSPYSAQEKFVATTLGTFFTKAAGNLADKELPFLKHLKQKQKHGFVWMVPWTVGDHSQIQEFSTGFEGWAVEGADVNKSGTETVKYHGMPIVFSALEERFADGNEDNQVELIESRTKAVMGKFQRAFHARALGLTGSGLSSINSLNGIDFSSGFLERAAVGSQANTVHGLSKSTYAAYYRTQNQVGDALNNAASNLIPSLQSIVIRRRKVGGKTAGSVWYFSESTAENWERIVGARDQYVNAAGRKDLLDNAPMTFRQMPIEVTDDMPSAGTNTTTYPIGVYLVDHDRIVYCAHQARNSKSEPKGPLFFKKGQTERLSGTQIYLTPVWLAGQLMAIEPDGDSFNLATSGLIVRSNQWM